MAGFAAGTLAGMWFEDRLALGDVSVYVIHARMGRVAHRVRKAPLRERLELTAHGHTGSGDHGWYCDTASARELPHLVDYRCRSFVTVG